MKELEDLVKAWRALPPGTPVALATVVATSGSTYRKAGAKMLITPEGWIAGSISGGCLEGELTQSAWEKTAEGPALLTYDATAEEDILWGFGLGCNGLVQVFLERIDEKGGPLSYFAERYDRREAGHVATILSPGPKFGQHVYGRPGDEVIDFSNVRTVDGVTWFFDAITRPLQLMVFGAGHDALPLVRLAKALGWRVTVVDKRSSSLTVDRFPLADALVTYSAEDPVRTVDISSDTAVVLMTHNYLQDRFLLRLALASDAYYVGLLGPKLRADRLLQELRDDGFVPTPRQLELLHAPIGLDLGANGPDEIALAIVAEIQAFANSRRPTPLRESTTPLHRTQCNLSA